MKKSLFIVLAYSTLLTLSELAYRIGVQHSPAQRRSNCGNIRADCGFCRRVSVCPIPCQPRFDFRLFRGKHDNQQYPLHGLPKLDNGHQLLADVQRNHRSGHRGRVDAFAGVAARAVGAGGKRAVFSLADSAAKRTALPISFFSPPWR